MVPRRLHFSQTKKIKKKKIVKKKSFSKTMLLFLAKAQKFQEQKERVCERVGVCLSFSFSLSLSLTHTHIQAKRHS